MEQGISIDCGCFGTGGEVAPEDTNYPTKIAENAGMSALCIWLLVRPRTLLSLDRLLLGAPPVPSDDGAETFHDEAAEADLH